MAMGRQATRNNDQHICNFIRPGSPPIPHIGGPISVQAGRTVNINKKYAATFSDEAECTGVGSSPPPKDSIIGGCLKVFINGKPAARAMEKTYGGSLVAGSPDVNYGDKYSSLAEKAANWLHQYLAGQKHIPFDHPWDGCYARAHEMKRIMEQQFNVELKKVFVFGNLKPVTGTLHGNSTPVVWWYHVAPLVEGIDNIGNPIQYVIDPSLSPDTVLTKKEWLDLSKGSGNLDPSMPHRIDNATTYVPSGSTDTNYIDTTNILNSKHNRKIVNGEYADPDPNLYSKIVTKDSYPAPVIKSPHIP